MTEVIVISGFWSPASPPTEIYARYIGYMVTPTSQKSREYILQTHFSPALSNSLSGTPLLPRPSQYARRVAQRGQPSRPPSQTPHPATASTSARRRRRRTPAFRANRMHHHRTERHKPATELPRPLPPHRDPSFSKRARSSALSKIRPAPAFHPASGITGSAALPVLRAISTTTPLPRWVSMGAAVVLPRAHPSELSRPLPVPS